MKALKLFSIVIPCRDEELSIVATVTDIHSDMSKGKVPHEIVVVNDGSSDGSLAALTTLSKSIPELVVHDSTGPNGFGLAIRRGLEVASGDAVVIMMGDGSDSGTDAIEYWKQLNLGYDCVFGSRFIRGSKVSGYPPLKLCINRIANWFLKLAFRTKLNDVTNAFKAYRTSTIRGIQPILAPHFNITVELPLKAIVRGYSYKVIPISWAGRRHGASKLKIKEMGSRYCFIAAYVWLERFFTGGDYRKQDKKHHE